MADSHLCLLVLIVYLLWRVLLSRQHQPTQSHPKAVRTTRLRLLKPRTPDDCPQCRRETLSPALEKPKPRSIRPWSEVKSRRGAPEQIDTQGFACGRPGCIYFGVADAQLHALVGDGAHGKAERIQTLHSVQGRLFRCQACGHTLTSRRHTPLYRLKTASQRIAEVLAALAEGLDVSAAVRVFGHSEATITRWLRRAGDHGETLHDR